MANSEQGSTSSVYTMRELNLGNCSFMKPEKFTGYHESFISVNGTKGFVLQSPKLILRNSTSSYFEFLISRNKDRHKEFYNIISHLEDSAIVQISQNSLEWFGREIKRDQAETMFRSTIHRPLEINDPYILRINKVGNMDCELNYPVVCLIKIDGIIFGRNSSMLDMKIVQIKVMKTEKIPSEDDFVDHTHQAIPEKPFYNDNASVVPSEFTGKRPVPIVTNLSSVDEEKAEEEKTETMIEKVDELHYSPEQEEKQQLQDIVADEKVVEKEIEKVVEKVVEKEVEPVVPQPIEPPSPVKSIQTVRTQRTQPTVQPTPVSIDSIKCEIMRCMVDNDFQRVKELGDILKNLSR